MHSVGLRMLRKRDEHHRLQNDSIKAPKAESLWGPGFPKIGFKFSGFCMCFGHFVCLVSSYIQSTSHFVFWDTLRCLNVYWWPHTDF